MDDYQKTIRIFKDLYKDISKYCSQCDCCCFTYGWLIPYEVSKFNLKKVELNRNVCCFDSFKRDSEGNRILNVIPRCCFYGNNFCSIQANKPLDCLIYPTKILYSSKKKSFSVVLSLDCPYVQKLSTIEKNKLVEKIKDIFSGDLNPILLEYFNIVKSWEDLTIPKKFKYELVSEIKDPFV